MKARAIFGKDDPPAGIVNGRLTTTPIFDLIDGEIVEIKSNKVEKQDCLYSRIDSFLLSLKKG